MNDPRARAAFLRAEYGAQDAYDACVRASGHLSPCSCGTCQTLALTPADVAWLRSNGWSPPADFGSAV